MIALLATVASLLSAGDGSLAAIRALREAELSAGATALAAGPAGDAVAGEFASLAARAVRARATAATAPALAAEEEALERARRDLATRIAPTDPDAARELLLQCAEDLLLRRLAADASDAAVALGAATPTEQAVIGAVLERAEAALGHALVAPLLEGPADLATDAGVFRTRFLAGLAAVTRADLERQNATGPDRTRAARLLADAAKSELRVPPSIAQTLALARSRAAAADTERSRLLDEARAAADPTLRFVAEVLAWRAAGANAPFPRSPAEGVAMATLAAVAESCARRELGQPLAAWTAPLERLTRTHGAPAALSAASRLDEATRASIAADRAAPAIAVALAALHPDGGRMLDERAGGLVDLASDPAVARWLALPLARTLATKGLRLEACAVLRAFVEGSEGSPAGRAALDVALDLAREAAGRDAQGEVALERTLALAGRLHFADPNYASWILERVDLALQPRWSAPDPALAARVIVALPEDGETDVEGRAARALRVVEIEAARAKRADAAELARRAEPLARSASARIAARATLVLAEMRALDGRDKEAVPALERVLAEPEAGPRTHARATRLWLELTARSKERLAPPAGLAALVRANPEAGEAVRSTIEHGCASLVARLHEGRSVDTEPGNGPGARLRTLAEIAPDGLDDRDALVLALATARLDDAVRLGERFDESEREPRWLLAEALLGRGGPGDEARAFEILRALGTLQAPERDALWWTANCRQLEVLARRPGRAGDIIARLNRLAALDPRLGGETTSARLDTVRRKAEDALSKEPRR